MSPPDDGAALPVAATQAPQDAPVPACDPTLPIAAHAAQIMDALARHQVIVVCGATGSGKTTQLPRLCLAGGRGTAGVIGHTQPRRIAARAIAARIAEELGTGLGSRVGYQVRFEQRIGADCRIKVMTDGILLRELETDPALRRYDTIIVDEAHERTLNIDLLLGMLRRLAPRRPDLRIVITSATIDPEKFARFFGGAPVIAIEGRSYPVEVRWRPPAQEDSLPQAVLAALRELEAEPDTRRGDVLVFLPGEQHIRETSEELTRAGVPAAAIVPLYARLALRDQARIFAPHATRRVVLATNVAETSLTVPGIRHVIDSGLARISRYSVRAKVERLPVEPIAQASAEQRRGRAGREAPGVCIRLYAQEDYAARTPYTDPEVLRSNLASVLLRMASVGLGDPESFPFLDPPDARLVRDGVRLLQELEALDATGAVTPLGRRIALLPLDPRLGRMLLAAARHDCVAEMLILAAFLEAQDPRDRPADRAREAAARHAAFSDVRSDFIAVLKLWRAWMEQSAQLTRGALRRWCEQNFLSFLRMREWQALHEQLGRTLRELGIRPASAPASYGQLHRALLSGFLGSIGRLGEQREYVGPRGVRFRIAPGTPLASRTPRWVVAGSLVETRRVYARMVAAVQPGWIEQAAAHLVRREYSEPEWIQAHGFVAARETVTFQGLRLSAHRRVNFGRIAPAEARSVFIREALLAHAPAAAPAASAERPAPQAGPRVTAPFLAANLALRASLDALERRIRRRAIVVSEEAQVEFYAARIPQEVNSIATFERWWAALSPAQAQALYMQRHELIRPDAPVVDPAAYPETLAVGEHALALEYCFDPEDPADGITLLVPEPLLPELDADRLAWLVPGLQQQKIEAVLRALPRALRRQLVPVPASAREALSERPVTLPGLYAWLAGWVSRRLDVPVSASELAALPVPAHLRLNFRVLAEDGQVLAQGRDLALIRARIYRSGHDVGFGPGSGQAAPPEPVHRSWDFGELATTRVIRRAGAQITVYPALEAREGGVVLTEARTASGAARATRMGIARLAMLALPQLCAGLHKDLSADRELVLLSRGIELAPPMPECLVLRAVMDCIVPVSELLPRTHAEFVRALERRGGIAAQAESLARSTRLILAARREVRIELERLSTRGAAGALADVEEQLADLFTPDVLVQAGAAQLARMPVWLQAAQRRLLRLPADAARDGRLQAQVRPFALAWRALSALPAAALAQAELELLHRMIEEFRLSLWAQDLKAALRVSERRLQEQLERTRAAMHVS